MAQPMKRAFLLLTLTGALSAQPLRPGDHLQIRVFALEEYEQRYTIGPDGKFCHALAGEFQTSGKTLEQLRNFLRQQFKHNLRRPEFSLRLGEPSSEFDVAVLGEVRHQGRFPVTPGARWSDLIARAGGLTETADLDLAVILRGEKELPLREDLKILPEDTLCIPRATTIILSGAVTNPGRYSISRSSPHSPQQLLALAGGLKQPLWNPRFLVVRPYLKKPQEVVATKELSLEDGDNICVVPRTCTVAGLVRFPGHYQLKGNDTLAAIMTECRSDNARLDRVTVERANGRSTEVYNLESDDQPPIPIFEGDIIWVPDSPAPSRQAALIEKLNVPGALDLYRGFFSF